MTEKYISSEEFKCLLAEKADAVDDVLGQLLDGQADIHPELKEAMGYTLKAPGKRIRGAMVLWCCEVVCGEITEAAKAAAAAVEMVHTYSLVHDDLPAMDDDDMRRGLPTCHKAFGESTAILAGDGLLTLAFEVLAEKVCSPEVAVKMISILSKAAGAAGMIAGQVADIAGEKTDGGMDELEYIHINKTAKMFVASASMGAVAGEGTDEQVAAMSDYGMSIGLGFQVADDILDVSALSEELGKTAGKDQIQGKITYPAVVGLDESKKIAEELANKAISSLSIFDEKADVLRQLSLELLARTR